MKQKALCPICKKESDHLDVFEVDPNEEFCYCPICGKKISTKNAIENFRITIRQMVRKANYQVHIAGKFEKAYRNFGEILTLQPENPFALTGRAVSLMLMSTLRVQRFDDALTLINFSKSELRKPKNQITHFEFLSRTETILKLYIETIKDKLTYKGQFYDEECIALYLKRSSLISKLMRLVLLEISNLTNKGLTNSRVSLRFDETQKFYDNLVESLKGTFLDIDGNSYKVGSIENGNFNLIKVEEDPLKKLEPKIKKSLSFKDKGTKVIQDRVFKARRAKFILCTALMAGASFFLLLGTLFLAFAFIFIEFNIPFFTACGVSYFLALAGFVTRFIIKKKIKKSRLLNIAVEF